MRAVLALLSVLLLSGVLSGCVGEDGFPAVAGITGVPMDAPTVIGKGGTSVPVRVVLETSNGTPVPRAALAVYLIPDPVKSLPPHVLKTRNTTLVGRTDDNGSATLRLDGGRYYTLIAQGNETTWEARHRFRPEEIEGTLVVRLFRTIAEVKWQAVAPFTPPPGPPGARTHPPVFFAREVRFHEDEKVQKEYVLRLESLNARLTYSPLPPEGGGEFGVRLAFSDSYCRDLLPVVSQPPGPVQRPMNTIGAYLRYGAALSNAKLRFGPTTYDGIYNPAGAQYSVEAVATFSNDPIQPQRWYYTCVGGK